MHTPGRPCTEFSSSALWSGEEMALASQGLTAGVSLWLPRASGKHDSSLQECFTKHVLVYVGQLEYSLTDWLYYRLHFETTSRFTLVT